MTLTRKQSCSLSTKTKQYYQHHSKSIFLRSAMHAIVEFHVYFQWHRVRLHAIRCLGRCSCQHGNKKHILFSRFGRFVWPPYIAKHIYNWNGGWYALLNWYNSQSILYFVKSTRGHGRWQLRIFSISCDNVIRKSKDYVYGIWVYKALGIWKGYYRVKKITCFIHETVNRGNVTRCCR